MLLRKVEKKFIFSGGRNRNKELEEVAKEDPDYLYWLFNSREVVWALSDEVHAALVDAMERHKIPFSKEKKSRVASKHESHHRKGIQRRAGIHLRG